jgi:hypothetical protein
MGKERSDSDWAREQLIGEGFTEDKWSKFLQMAGNNISGLHEVTALILIAQGIYPRPIEKVIEKLKKEGLADGAGIDSARNS